MTDPTTAGAPGDADDISSIYGEDAAEPPKPVPSRRTRPTFQPWHHPVKQIVRAYQWARLTEGLIKKSRPEGDVLQYFTLPGADLLDVRVLADACHPLGVTIEYFGFDASGVPGSAPARDTAVESPVATAGTELFQAGWVTAESLILGDRLEEVAVPSSHASEQLRKRRPFHVVNIDACDHLAYAPTGRQRTTFDALRCLLDHQKDARSPWLLFITTRVDPGLLGTDPILAFQHAISENLQCARDDFGAALAAAIEAEPAQLGMAMGAAWGIHDQKFLRLFSIGLGKFLLQFFHAQPNMPADVQLASVYAYRVHHDAPDMLSLAFRIEPEERRTFAPSARGVAVYGDLEPVRAVRVATQAIKLQDLDHEIRSDNNLRHEAFDSTAKLLRSANYDVDAWERWVGEHPRGPLVR